jgi:hypothetical protein
VSAERSIGSRVSWGSSRTANERTSLVSNPCSRGSRDRALGSRPANKDDGRSSAAEHQTPVVATEAVAESCSVRADQATCKLVEPVQRESADRLRAERMPHGQPAAEPGDGGSSPADRSGRHQALPSSAAMHRATARSCRRSRSSVGSLASTAAVAKPRCWSLWSSRVSVWIWPMSRACSPRRSVGWNGLAVRPVVIGYAASGRVGRVRQASTATVRAIAATTPPKISKVVGSATCATTMPARTAGSEREA